MSPNPDKPEPLSKREQELVMLLTAAASALRVRDRDSPLALKIHDYLSRNVSPSYMLRPRTAAIDTSTSL